MVELCRKAAAPTGMVAAIRKLDNLHPEYEIYDWNRKSQFLDFAFLTPFGRFGMIHFSFDDIQNRPEVCRMLLQLVIGPHLLRNLTTNSISPEEKEVLRLAVNLGKPIRPKDIILHSEVNFRTARKWLHCLVEKGILRSITRGKYACYYELKEGTWQHLI